MLRRPRRRDDRSARCRERGSANHVRDAPRHISACEATISLIWDPNDEPDLDGYIVLRRAAPDAPWTAITPQPIQETTFRDGVPPEAHYWYSVQAVDKARNVSEAAPAVDETAR